MKKALGLKRKHVPLRMTRREVLARGIRGGILAGAVSILRPRTLASVASGAMESDLVFACDGGNTQRMFENQFFPDFYRKYGVRIRYVPGQNADILAKLRVQRRSPSMDVVWLAGGNTYQAIDGGLLAEMDRSLVPNYALVAPGVGDEKTVAPIGISTCCLIYNSDVFKKRGFSPPTSYWDLWDTKYKGHIGLYSINVTAATALLVKIAQLLTGNYKNVDPAFQKFSDLRPNMLDFFVSSGTYETEIQQGDLWLGAITSPRGMQLKNSGMPVGVTQPKEGPVGYQTWAGVVKNATHPNAAHAWINYLLSTEVQEKIARTIGYNPVNAQAKIPEELRLYFPSLDTVFIPDWRYLATQLPMIVERWNRKVEE
jgi:putative spermidine/putrescine transport system substrate-binding protein